jgi:hypothetical protein
MCRTEIDVYSADPTALAAKLDELCSMSDEYLRKTMKQAVDLGYRSYSPDVLNPRYMELLSE